MAMYSDTFISKFYQMCGNNPPGTAYNLTLELLNVSSRTGDEPVHT